MWLELDRLGLTVKEKVPADEQRRPAVATARRQWIETLPLHDAAQSSSLRSPGVTPISHGGTPRSLRARRIADHTPCSHWQTHTVVAAGRLTATAVFDGPIDGVTFRA